MLRRPGRGVSSKKLRVCSYIMLIGFHLCLHLALGVPVDCLLQLLCSRAREPIIRGKEEGWWLVFLPVRA